MKYLMKFVVVSVLLLGGGVVSAEVIDIPPYDDMQGKTLTERQCLTVNLYHESRGESDIANMAIASTVYARSLLGGRYGSTMCEVVFKRGQYSWTNDGRSDRIRDKEQYERLYLLTGEFLYNKDVYLALFEYSNHYHVIGHKTNWNYRKLDYISTIDNHIFYRHK